jgi:hypothetical protein
LPVPPTVAGLPRVADSPAAESPLLAASPAAGDSPGLAGSPEMTAALRANARYIEEVVIGWNLCPWAARAWRAGEVARRVLAGEASEDGLVVGLDVAPVLAFIDELSAAPALAIGLAIFSRATVTVAAFGAFAERVRRADRARRPPDAVAPFLLAAFHPDFGAGSDFRNAGQLVSFIRRTPDPTLQLVRESLVADLARGGHDLSADIARDNFATVTARDPARLGTLLDEIRRERDRHRG